MTFDLHPDWDCMICGDTRPDERISVEHRPVVGMEDAFPATRWNVRYCNDRSACVAAAKEWAPTPHN